MTIHERIRKARIRKGLTMEELAAKVGYRSRSAIAKVEAGERSINHDMILKYCEALEVPYIWLLLGEDVKKVNADELLWFKKTIEADFTFLATSNNCIGGDIKSGDQLYLKRDEQIENGEIALVSIDNTNYLVYWYHYPEQCKLLLISVNPEKEPFFFYGDDIQKVLRIGKVVHILTTPKRRKYGNDT